MVSAFCRAVVKTHPDPAALKQAWDEEISGLFSGGLLAGAPVAQESLLLKQMIDKAFPTEG